MSAIEWTDKTWNPVTGCSKISPGCKNCYAEAIANRLWPTQYPYEALGSENPRPREFRDLRVHRERLAEPLSWKKPCMVFVNSMSDLFHEDLSDQFVTDVFGIMALAHWHTFQVLTKRPQRMLDYLSQGDHGIIQQFRQIQEGGGISIPGVFRALDLKRRDSVSWQWPLSNVWLGVSVENQQYADERIPLLLQTPAAVRFLSAEPLLEAITLNDLPVPGKEPFRFSALTDHDDEHFYNVHPKLDWVICGGESGPGARQFNPAWAGKLLGQCRSADVPFFMKQFGSNCYWRDSDAPRDNKKYSLATPLLRDRAAIALGEELNHWCRVKLKDRKGGDPSEWPEEIRVREWPKVKAREVAA